MPDNSNQPAGNPRRRIVIPLGSEKRSSKPISSRTASQGRPTDSAARPRSSRILRVLSGIAVSILVIVVLVAGGIFLWWQHLKTTPAYSLAVLIDASQKNDPATAQTVVDTEQVVKNLADEVAEKAANRYGLALGSNGRDQIRALTPKLLPRMKETVDNYLVEQVKRMSAPGGERQPFLFLVFMVPRALTIAVSDDHNSATVQAPGRSEKIEMSRAGDGWKIVAFRDEALVQQAIDQVIKDLPAVGLGSDRKGADDRKRGSGIPALRLQ